MGACPQVQRAPGRAAQVLARGRRLILQGRRLHQPLAQPAGLAPQGHPESLHLRLVRRFLHHTDMKEIRDRTFTIAFLLLPCMYACTLTIALLLPCMYVCLLANLKGSRLLTRAAFLSWDPGLDIIIFPALN